MWTEIRRALGGIHIQTRRPVGESCRLEHFLRYSPLWGPPDTVEGSGLQRPLRLYSASQLLVMLTKRGDVERCARRTIKLMTLNLRIEVDPDRETAGAVF
jgi:hypothetical protein